MGRKKIVKEGKFKIYRSTPQATVSLPPKVFEALGEYAHKKHMDKSTILRQSLLDNKEFLKFMQDNGFSE